MNVLVTGGAGFVGANLAISLKHRGHEVTCLDNLVRRGSELNVGRLKEAGVHFIHGDCRCPEDVPDIAFDAVCHTAAQPSAIDGYQSPMYDLSNNVDALFPVLELCRRYRSILVFWSSNKVYPCHAVDAIGYHESADADVLAEPVSEHLGLNGDDRSLYGATKLAGEVLAREYGRAFDFPVYINRFSCLAGPWQWGKTEQGWVAWWVIAHVFGWPLTYIGFDGKQTRDVLHIDDVCALVGKQIVADQPGVYNVGGGAQNVLSLRQATRMCQSITGNNVEMLAEPTPRQADFRSYVSDITRVSIFFDWVPTRTPYETLEDIYLWVKDNKSKIEYLLTTAR